MALSVPVLTYAGIRWQRSGRIGSSEAADLWKESSQLREHLREDYRELRAELASVRAENDALRVEMTSLRVEFDVCQRERRAAIERLVAAGLSHPEGGFRA